MARYHFTPAQLAARSRALQIAVDRYAADGGPTDIETRAAPTMHKWSVFVADDGTRRLHGFVARHPRFGAGVVMSSPIVVMDDEGRWARTEGRLYALGERAPVDDNEPSMEVSGVSP